jgi:2-polyprenyl-3-methyl-5-hydroxy-6-metoxy-1,4-benzoquinol methylase
MTTTDISKQVTEQRDAFAGRLFGSAIGAMDLFTVYLGDQLGLYRALVELEGATPAELAMRTGTHARYVREWLEQQAATGILTVDDAGVPADARRYRLPAGHGEVLLDQESLSYMAAMARYMVAVARPLPAVLDAFRTGGGVSWAAYGGDAREAQAAFNRPMFTHQLPAEWMPAAPEVHARLQAGPPARVADIGCGAGWSSIAIAHAYLNARIDGFDLDAPSIALARANAAAAGVDGRVRFEARDAGDAALAGSYDLVTAFECIHDMSRPVEVLATARRLLAPGGAMLVADERVAETFTAPGDDLERLFYGFSVLCCLPAGMAEQPSAATGTVMRPETLRRYAAEAGFGTVEVLPIEHDFFRFYLLRP